MHYLSFEFQSLQQHNYPFWRLLEPQESATTRFLRDFNELRKEGTEAAVRRIVDQTQMVAKIDGQDYPAAVLAPLVKYVEEALLMGGPTSDHAVDVLDLPNSSTADCNIPSVIKVYVRRFTARAMVPDVPDDDEYDYDSDLDRLLCEEEEEEEDMDADDVAAEDEDEDEEEEGEPFDVEAFLTDHVMVEADAGGESNEEEEEGITRYYCGVCLDEIPAGSEATATTCRHIYHGDCIRKWLRQRSNSPACPLCRFPARENRMTDDMEPDLRD